MTTMGERIKISREKKGLLQSDLAKMINAKSGAVISNWEKNVNRPDADKIVKLCKALDISASYLLDYNGNENIDLNPYEIEIIKKYRTLDKHGKEIINILLDKEYERCAAFNPSGYNEKTAQKLEAQLLEAIAESEAKDTKTVG